MNKLQIIFGTIGFIVALFLFVILLESFNKTSVKSSTAEEEDGGGEATRKPATTRCEKFLEILDNSNDAGLDDLPDYVCDNLKKEGSTMNAYCKNFMNKHILNIFALNGELNETSCSNIHFSREVHYFWHRMFIVDADEDDS